ncbi:hypothetical protein COCMIDRAFT_8585 [Bipolaris oryzae ATCC 44560]|uniref:Uncharacterized protein n=1 Tax=Bipolaris oryzae ATCC 44560 TaxID=930090 RepID=W6YW28_COCMI|nr:uncharacterized protein COCMIDRAFT_8585 [Bipolaris oryzae ATCC 44560]EUC41745.1 hypothetical protein COCMIDRAFT_8585 [Bipolaris oryzae ATCC 44560]
MAETRTTSTSTGQYDLLLAMSQDSVNSGLSAMWDLDGDNMDSIEFDGETVGIIGNINGKIGAPDVQVIAAGAGRGSVLFRLTFTEGTTAVFNKATKKKEKKNLKGFQIAFKVDIALDSLHNEVTRYETQLRDSRNTPEETQELQAKLDKVKKTIESFGKQAGDFSIQRLFLDFTTADISSLPESELRMPGMDANQITAFASMLHQWLTTNKESSSTTLGYGLAIDPAKASNYKVADVLMPTWVNLQTYPYKSDPGADPKLGWTGDAARNCVTYCNMTENRAVQGERTLAWSGNFTTINPDKEKRIDGTAIIRKGLFLDKFVIPMLRQYNDDLQIVAETMEISRDGPAGQRRFHWTYSSALGRHGSYQWTDPYYDFTQNAQGMNLNNVNTRDHFQDAVNKGFDAVSRADGVSWSWSKSCDTGTKSSNQDWHFPQDFCNWSDHLSGRNMSYSAVDVVPIPGQGRIKIRGFTEAKVQYDGYYTRLVESNLKYVGNLFVQAFWQVDIVLSSTSADGMKTSFENQHAFVFPYHDEQGVPNDKTNSREFVNKLEHQIPEMLKEKNSICKAINDALEATGKFTHPCAGEFNLKDPVFNRNGDLLFTAQYKAPVAGRLRSMPAIGEEVSQRDPSDPGKYIEVTGDVQAPIGKKGG